jgi:hypothetical protein
MVSIYFLRFREQTTIQRSQTKYRRPESQYVPMDMLDEYTSEKADCILANSKFIYRPSNWTRMDSERRRQWREGGPGIVYPRINLEECGQETTTAEEDDINVLKAIDRHLSR